MKHVIGILILLFSLSLTHAQTAERPLILPMQTDASPSTWLLGQPYGNTIGAFRNADRWYSAGQGLHFGLDFGMPCGTPLVAVADGQVTFVDNFNFGSRPHNVIIQHPNLGLSSLYGHLLDTSELVEGTWVTQGQLVGYSGDPDETCESRPHLHYELRSLDYRTAINPVPYMDANWHSLATVGSFRYPMFEQNLDNARQWLNLDIQPDITFGGMRLNNYNATFTNSVPPQYYASPPPAQQLPILYNDTPVSLNQLGFDGCCQRYWWSKDNPDRFYAVDGGLNQRAGVYEWSVTNASPTGNVNSLSIPVTSPDGTYEVVLIDNRAYLRRRADGELTPTPVMNQIPAISPNNIHLLWIEEAEAEQFTDRPQSNIFVSNLDGSSSRMIYSDLSTSAMWLDDNRLLLTIRENRDFTLAILNIIDGTLAPLGTYNNMRGMTVSPGGTRLMFYLTYQDDPSLDGMYTIETKANAQPQKLPWFGGYNWRDSDSVYYIPFNITTDLHQLAYFHIPTGTNIMLTDPTTTPFTIMNGDWSVSPDGRHILFHNALNRNLWTLTVNG